MRLIYGMILLALFASCSSESTLKRENERLKLEVQNLQVHANALQAESKARIDEVVMEAEQNLEEAARQRALALAAKEEAEKLAAELAKCKNQ